MPSLLALACALACASERGSGDDPGATSEGGDTSGAGESSGATHDGPVDLVLSSAWVRDGAVDPMPAHAPATVTCEFGFDDEIGLFEVDTGACNYGVFTQPSVAAIDAGDTVTFVLTHDDLLAPEPAVGHVLFTIDGEVAFDLEIEIPRPTTSLQASWTPRAHRSGGAGGHAPAQPRLQQLAGGLPRGRPAVAPHGAW
ncbi:MAG: hypothetical protein IPK74_00220 [Deltaproteobacteria bacterium]|nr:hypothetical protein [Deltaproteobacteria bacterium]